LPWSWEFLARILPAATAMDNMTSLKPRQRAVLAAAIEQYVETAEPVGSALLAAHPLLTAVFGAVSPATVRNDLAALEDAGLLAQPHTSAGRVPTDAGYRYYVDEMLKPRPVRASERAQIRSNIAAPLSSMEDALREATSTLARLTGYPAVATLPAARLDTLRHLQINKVPPHRLILILVTAAGQIEHRLFEVENEVPSARLNTVVHFLNTAISGQPLSELRAQSFESVAAGLHEEETITLARRAWELMRRSVGEISDERVIVQGLVTLLEEPEFSDIERARAAMRLFEDVATMSDLLRPALPAAEYSESGKPVRTHTIVIGHEHARADHPAVERLSLVGISYGTDGEVLGTVGVLGPTRMKYGEAAALVPVLAARLQQCLETL
jgi:heat-inducible transcriptional repressor